MAAHTAEIDRLAQCPLLHQLPCIRQLPDGKTVEGFLTADNCIVDRKSKSGWVQGNAHMDWDGTAIKGRGIYFSFEREFIKIFSQTEIRAKSLKLGSGKELLQ